MAHRAGKRGRVVGAEVDRGNNDAAGCGHVFVSHRLQAARKSKENVENEDGKPVNKKRPDLHDRSIYSSKKSLAKWVLIDD